jgi:hypothetical protein
MPVSNQVRVTSQPMPQVQTAHDTLLRQLQERGDWTDAHLDTLRMRLDACLEPAPTGNMRAISPWFSRNKAHWKTYRDTYMGFYEGFSENPQWMKGMSEAIARHQAARQAPAQENDSDLQRAIAASLASHKEETKARQQVQPDNDLAKAIEASLRDQEAEELQRAIAASLSNSTDVLMAEMAAGNNRFRASIASHGIEIVPNKGGAYMNSCLIASMLQHALGMHGGDKLMEDALALKLEMAERFPNEVSADGLMHADSNSPAMTWLRNEIHRRHGVWIDPHIVVADNSGKPILTEQRQPLPGHKPVVIWNEGAHFQALFDSQSGGRNGMYEMAKQASGRRFA